MSEPPPPTHTHTPLRLGNRAGAIYTLAKTWNTGRSNLEKDGIQVRVQVLPPLNTRPPGTARGAGAAVAEVAPAAAARA